MDLTIRVKKFIEKEWDRSSPLLLGYSGGGDSKSLLYALLESPAAGALHLAHVDHGWRGNSQEEASLLAQEAAALNLPFHTIRLDQPLGGNAEEAGRLGRLSFFRSLFEKIPFQALLLAHHADDVAETALKRLFEGAHLQNMGGMKEIASFDQMAIWRPLLRVKKSALMGGGLDDPTNRDPKYLRSRLRMEILPLLSQSFGKEVSENLSLLSERAFELREYLDKKIASIDTLEGPWGKAAYLETIDRIEARHFLLRWGFASRECLESALDHLSESDLCFGPLRVDRGWLFLPTTQGPEFGEEIPLAPGRFTSGDWEIEVEENQHPLPPLRWQELWKGNFVVTLPDGVLTKNSHSSSEEYRVAKVPPFLRGQLPVLGGKTLFQKTPFPRWRVRFFVNVNALSSRSCEKLKVPLETI